jgi:Na+/phosphate symporter
MLTSLILAFLSSIGSAFIVCVLILWARGYIGFVFALLNTFHDIMLGRISAVHYITNIEVEDEEDEED